MHTSALDNFLLAETVLFTLKEQFGEADAAWCCDAEMVSTLMQGLELATLLMRDVERRLRGCPPAALEAAVQSFLERVERLSRQPRPLMVLSAPHVAH